jgi:hypothetical protein
MTIRKKKKEKECQFLKLCRHVAKTFYAIIYGLDWWFFFVHKIVYVIFSKKKNEQKSHKN